MLGLSNVVVGLFGMICISENIMMRMINIIGIKVIRWCIRKFVMFGFWFFL